MAVQLDWSKCNVGELTGDDDFLLERIAMFSSGNHMNRLTEANANEWLYRKCFLSAVRAVGEGHGEDHLVAVLGDNRNLIDAAVKRFDGLEVTSNIQQSREDFTRGVLLELEGPDEYGEMFDKERFAIALEIVDEFVAESARGPATVLSE